MSTLIGVLVAGLFLGPVHPVVKEITDPAGGLSAQGRGLLMREHTEHERDPKVQGMSHHVMRRITSHLGDGMSLLVVRIIDLQIGLLVQERFLQMGRTPCHPEGLLAQGRNLQLWRVSPNRGLLVQEKFLHAMRPIDQMRGLLVQEIFLQLMRGEACQDMVP